MQTFVPFADIDKSAESLDNKRLNKQLLEGRQVYSILSSQRTTGGWVNHPAVRMWRNYDMGLFSYLESVKDECVNRGISTDKNWSAILDMHEKNWHRGNNVVMPPWWGDDRVHLSHRYNLFHKAPELYGLFEHERNFTCCGKCNYFWPTHSSDYSV